MLFRSAGFRENFGPAAVCLVEWPERAVGALPAADITIDLELRGSGREAEISAHTEAGRSCLARLETH